MPLYTASSLSFARKSVGKNANRVNVRAWLRCVLRCFLLHGFSSNRETARSLMPLWLSPLTNHIKFTRFNIILLIHVLLIAFCCGLLCWLVLMLHVVLSSQQAMAKRPVSAVGNRRPITEYAKMAAAMGGHMRYKVPTPISQTARHFVLLKITLVM